MTDRRPDSDAADRDRAPDAPNPPDRTDSPGPDTVGVRHGMFGVRGSGDTTGFGGLVRPTEMPSSTPPPYEDDDDEVVIGFGDHIPAFLLRRARPVANPEA